MQRRILLFDTDLEICNSIQSAMGRNQAEIISTMSEMNAINILTQNDCYMVIMGLLPSADETLKIVHHIRSITKAPILMLVENVKNSDKIRLFQEGVTAYLEKPFDIDVCVAQANSLIQLYTEARAENREDKPLAFGRELMINPIYRQVMVDGEILDLTRTEFNLFFCMAQHPGQVWSRTQLYSQVWSDDLGIGGENVVKSHIGNLRRKLENMGKDYIQTSWGIGYKFVPPTGSEKNKTL